jgi:hypothetical protein
MLIVSESYQNHKNGAVSKQRCLEIFISSKSRNLLHISSVQLLDSVHCKRKKRKPDRKPYSLPYGLKKIHTETLSLRTLKIMPRNLNEVVNT